MKRSTATILALSPATGVGGLVLQAGLESSQIALILCFIVTHMHSNLITKFGLIWDLIPPADEQNLETQR